MGVFWLYWDRTVESIAWRERGIELNSGRRERSCTICWRTKHEAIGRQIIIVFKQFIIFVGFSDSDRKFGLFLKMIKN